MKISQLATETAVSVPTIKFYLREGLLAPGALTSRTQAVYDESHVRRLRLIRALVDVAGLSLERVRAVLDAIEHSSDGPVAMLAQATGNCEPGATPCATALVATLGWDVPEGLGSLGDLERALAALDSVGFDMPVERFRAIAEGVDRIAEAEIADVPTESAEAAVAYSVLGTELVAPAILALRRIAHARHTIARFEDGAVADPR